jgi:dTDP-4-amino-4,6-dideoxygalactose transaminase
VTAPLAEKLVVDDLAAFGGPQLFDRPRSTSNLSKPDIEQFLSYSRIFFDAHRYSNAGPVVMMLEARLAEFHDVRRCVSTVSGFWALVLGMKALALPGRSQVVMPSLSYRRLADAAVWAGLTPFFCEVDASTLAPTPETVSRCIGDDTALIVATHPIVNCCDAGGLSELARQQRLPILFDSVESVYETVGGRRTGSFGNAELFSLHASKLLNGFEGGYLTTADEDLADRLELIRAFGFLTQDTVVGLGTNAKLNEIHASMAMASLDDLERQVAHNRAGYEAYLSALAEIEGIRILRFDESESPAFKNIVVELEDEWPLGRDQTVGLLNAEGAFARAHYSPALHMTSPAYPTVHGDLSLTEELAKHFVVLPSGHQVDTADISGVAQLLSFLSANAEEIGRRWEARA